MSVNIKLTVPAGRRMTSGASMGTIILAEGDAGAGDVQTEVWGPSKYEFEGPHGSNRVK